MAALQVHDLGAVTQDAREEVALDGVEGGPGGCLREQVVVFADVLVRGRFPRFPVRLRHPVHAVMVFARRCRRQLLCATQTVDPQPYLARPTQPCEGRGARLAGCSRRPWTVVHVRGWQ